MPHRTRAEERIAAIDISPTKLLAELERITAERDEAQARADEYLTGLQRERAEFVNYKRRVEQDGAAAASRSADTLRLKVLDALDDFDRAIESRPVSLATDAWAEGIAAIDRKLRTLLEREGVRPMETSVGQPFDPKCLQFHENQRYARTASYAQVAVRLYDRSRFRYRHYRKHLEPIIPIIQHYIDRLGYTVE